MTSAATPSAPASAGPCPFASPPGMSLGTGQGMDADAGISAEREDTLSWADFHTPLLPGGVTGRVTHAPYRREPYVRCRTPSSPALPSGVLDAKAAAWTRTAVLLHWLDDGGRAHNKWVPAEFVHRVSRDESAWQDPYDDWSFYYPHQVSPRLAAAAA